MPKPIRKVHAHCHGAGKGPEKEAKTCCGVPADFRRDIWCAITGRRMFPVNLVVVPTCGNCLRTFEYGRYKEYLSALKGVQYVEDLDDGHVTEGGE